MDRELNELKDDPKMRSMDSKLGHRNFPGTVQKSIMSRASFDKTGKTTPHTKSRFASISQQKFSVSGTSHITIKD